MDANQFISLISAEIIKSYAPKHQTLAPDEAKMEQYRWVITNLITQALGNGLTLPDVFPTFTHLSGGRTALVVSMATVPLNFVVKLDTKSKLIREARTIDELRNDIRLIDFRDRLPQIYAQYSSPETETFAYIMEMFSSDRYITLHEVLFGNPKLLPTEDEAQKKLLAVANVLFPAYKKTLDNRLEVRMLGEEYYQRIRGALLQLPELHEGFQPIRLIVNGVELPSWKVMLDELKTLGAKLQELAAPFVTFVHGDPNPGNIFLARYPDDANQVRFIDLKDWKSGDYVFDIAKINHALLHTRPLEKLKGYSEFNIDLTDRDCVHINYKRQHFAFAEVAAAALYKEMIGFATEMGDPHAAQRYRLAMASNLIGIVPSRFKGAPQVAQILYCEGLLLLKSFLNMF